MKKTALNPKRELPKPTALASVSGSVTALDGYRAAGIVIEQALDDADKKCPKRMNVNRKSAAYRVARYEALLMAHCQMALGEHPTHEMNEPVIRRILQSQNAKVSDVRGAHSLH